MNTPLLRTRLDYVVRALNPTVTELSPSLREEGGIRGVVSIGSAFPDDLVDWNTTARVEVFRVFENGKQRVYRQVVPVRSGEFSINIPYERFYQGDAQYLVTVAVGGMKSNKFFNIVGSDGVYGPVKGDVLPPTIASNNLYPQLMLLLMGMVAALSVRNHLRPRSWSLPVDYVAIGCGTAIFSVGMLQHQTEIVTKGMLLAGVGFMLIIAREHDTRINTLPMKGSPIHDFIGLILIFFSASYLVFLIPEWNLMFITGTLIVYYTLINLHGERERE